MENNVINDRYILTTDIGFGGYATVYLAFDNISNSYVAIKVLDCDVNEDEISLKKFNQEAMTIAAIDHPNVVRVYSSGIYNNNPYLVMDYVKGDSLKAIIDTNGYLLIDEVFSYTQQILFGIEACHNVNIIHRDIKPKNLIKKADGTIVIVDFGLALVTKEDFNLYKDESNLIACTVQYMAPELIEHSEGSVQSDIYALGITIFEMFTGRHPFPLSEKNSKADVVIMHQKTPFPSVRRINPNVPESFEKIIYKCCEKDPKNRYKNVSEIYHDLLIAYDEYKNPKKEKKSFFKRLFKK